jgi:hypothetical protein
MVGVAAALLTRVDLADDGVIDDVDDGVVGRPRPLVADGAVVGLVPVGFQNSAMRTDLRR